MVKFNFQKISQVPKNFFRKKKEISNYLWELRKILKRKDYSLPESFLILPEEKYSFTKIPKDFDLILIIGIGGSSLGAQAIFEAIKNKKNLTEILVLDSLNPLFFRKVVSKVKNLKKGRVAIFFISESGKTFETTANFFTLFKNIKKYQPKVFVISDKWSPLWNFAKKKNFLTFEIPKEIGGRYSVFSNVGLLPLKLAGVKIEELFLGAKEANRFCLQNSPLQNPALASAMTIFYHWKKRRKIYSNLIFPPDLEYFGKWYVQLMAESLGKDGKGITPIVTIGTTDFHAIGQLFFDGPKDKLINFIFVENLDSDFEIPREKDSDILFSGAGGKKIWEINRAIFEGVKKAYILKNLPFTETILERLDEKNLGFLMEMKMIEIILLAKLMKVNAFDQPGVELYKTETRKILEK